MIKRRHFQSTSLQDGSSVVAGGGMRLLTQTLGDLVEEGSHLNRQLRLVDAAHILPVGAAGSTDDVQNGVALSTTFHRAFDHGLIYLDENYSTQLNLRQEIQLTTLNLHAGLPDFRALLGRRIHLPADRHQWPDPLFIREANRHRRIA